MNLKKRNCIKLTFFAMLIVSVSAKGEEGEPSFSCSKASTVLEKRICQSSPYFNLKQVDRELAQEYRKALKIAPYPKKIIAEQRAWLKTLPICLNNKITVVPSYLCNFTEKQNPDKSISLEYEREQCAHDYCLVDEYNNRIQVLQDFQESLMPPFRLAKDTGWNVCRDYLKSLETLNPKPESLACDLNIAPNMPQFSLPDWQELNIEEHWDIVYAIENELKLGHPQSSPSFDIWRKNYLTRIQKGEIKPRLRQARLRISTDETEETFLGYTRNRDNIETCKKEIVARLNLSNPKYIGDTLYYRDQVSNKLLPVFPDTDANFSGDSENQVFLHNSTLYFISPGQRYSVISRIFKIKPISPITKLPLRYFGQGICQIIARLTPPAQP